MKNLYCHAVRGGDSKGFPIDKPNWVKHFHTVTGGDSVMVYIICHMCPPIRGHDSMRLEVEMRVRESDRKARERVICKWHGYPTAPTV